MNQTVPIRMDGQPEPRPDPYDATACWQCHGHKEMCAVTHECDDGTKTWIDVVCWRCNGSGKELRQ